MEEALDLSFDRLLMMMMMILVVINFIVTQNMNPFTVVIRLQ